MLQRFVTLFNILLGQPSSQEGIPEKHEMYEIDYRNHEIRERLGPSKDERNPEQGKHERRGELPRCPLSPRGLQKVKG